MANDFDKRHYEQNVMNNMKYGKSPRDNEDLLNFNAGNVKLVATPPQGRKLIPKFNLQTHDIAGAVPRDLKYKDKGKKKANFFP